MEREDLIQQIADLDHRLNKMTGRRGVHAAPMQDNSVGKVLRILYKAEGTLHPTDLCKELEVTTPRITTILNEMEEKGLITREISSEDRRKIVVVLTDKGKNAIEDRKKRDYEFICAVVDRIGEGGAERMLQDLQAYEEVYKEFTEKYEDFGNKHYGRHGSHNRGKC